MTPPRHQYQAPDERARRIADAVGAEFSRHLNCHSITDVKRRKVDLLLAAGFDVAVSKGNGVPRFQRNGGPLMLLSHALLVAEAFLEGRKAA